MRFIILLCLIANSIFGQAVVFHQGYVRHDTTVDIFPSTSYSMNITATSISLPDKTYNIISHYTKDGILNLQLDNGSYVKYWEELPYGKIIARPYGNGVMVLWTNILDYFSVDMPCPKD